MFKQFLVSVFLASLMLTSMMLWAQTTHDVDSGVKLNFDHKLTINDYSKDGGSYIQQVNQPKQVAVQPQESPLSVPEVAVFWVMLFALIVFVIRLSRRRLK